MRTSIKLLVKGMVRGLRPYRVFLPFYLLTFLPLTASAQSTFTERLQERKTGEGKITVTQDKSIDELVNKPATAIATTPRTNTTQPSANTQPRTNNTTTGEKKEELVTTPTETVTPDTTSLDPRKKVMKGYKVNGYRVQVFAGGNSRNDRMKAERAGEEIKSLFPTEPVYVHFYSPRWLCRMGNYRTYEEAYEVLRSVKKLGYNSAIIVKGKITVQYP